MLVVTPGSFTMVECLKSSSSSSQVNSMPTSTKNTLIVNTKEKKRKVLLTKISSTARTLGGVVHQVQEVGVGGAGGRQSAREGVAAPRARADDPVRLPSTDAVAGILDSRDEVLLFDFIIRNLIAKPLLLISCLMKL